MTRLPTVPLTPEDSAIRCFVDARFLSLISPRPLPQWPSFSWILSDRSDALLMLDIVRGWLWPGDEWPAGHGQRQILMATVGLSFREAETCL
jgi:hypothetical protein